MNSYVKLVGFDIHIHIHLRATLYHLVSPCITLYHPVSPCITLKYEFKLTILNNVIC